MADDALRVLVCGSRNYTDATKIKDALRQVIADYWDAADHGTPRLVIIHGDCPTGADALADHAALMLEVDTERYPADWKKHRRRAGPIRNGWMLDQRPYLVLAFGRGKGTDGCVREAERRGIPVQRFA